MLTLFLIKRLNKNEFGENISLWFLILAIGKNNEIEKPVQCKMFAGVLEILTGIREWVTSRTNACKTHGNSKEKDFQFQSSLCLWGQVMIARLIEM
jgi:hypothetical protein